MIIQVVDKVGILILCFCYYEKLLIVVNCCMCLVDVEKLFKLVLVCVMLVMDGMKVVICSEKVLKFQCLVMEFLLINYLLDCLICDQGGECELQDVLFGYGCLVSCFNECKCVVLDEDMGLLVVIEMICCIQCMCCVCFIVDVVGIYELGGMYCGENLQIGIYDGKLLIIELFGNVVDVCLVGVLINKVFQFCVCLWELIVCELLGYYDVMGLNLFLYVCCGEVLCVVLCDNELVNECWLFDCDCYFYQGLYSDDCVVKLLCKVNGEWKEVSWVEGLVVVKEIFVVYQGDDFGVLVYLLVFNEEGVLLV